MNGILKHREAPFQNNAKFVWLFVLMLYYIIPAL